jgi:hypothetical protein
VITSHCTPTKRGFDSFLGYYSACEMDYFYHNASEMNDWNCGLPKFPPQADLTNNTGGTFKGADAAAHGVYSTHLFTNHAIGIIKNHAANNSATSLYIYLAYQNVHLACGDGKKPGSDGGAGGPVQSPCSSVDKFPMIAQDTAKAQAANMLELDYGVGNVTAALAAVGYWNDTVLILVSGE